MSGLEEKYHISEGELRRCTAHIEECPLSSGGADVEHFTGNLQDAESWFEDKNTSEAGGSFGVLSPAQKTVKKDKVYRVGNLSAPEDHFNDLDGVLAAMDALKPEDRQGRRGGIFASPDMASHSRWVLGNKWNKYEGALDSHEIEVDANSVYVYNVKKYEKASTAFDRYGDSHEGFIDAAQDFWDSGMTLNEWREWARHNDPDPGDWEIIMPSDGIRSSKKMSNKSVIEEAPESKADTVNEILEPERARKGLIWRKSDLTEPEIDLVREESAKAFSADFINDMETLYSKNAYREDDLYSAKNHIWRTLQDIREKRDGSVPHVIENDKDDTLKDVYAYIRIVDEVRNIRDAQDSEV